MIKKIFVLLLAGLILNPGVNATEVSNRPIIFIHGFNIFGFGEDCKKDWGKLEQSLVAQGFTGQMVTFGYYGNDPHCDVITTPKGSIMTPVQSLAKDIAWSIYNRYSANNVSIDVVAHSLGGLLIRYALYRSSIGDVTYPPFLKVSHVTTLGSPFTGYNLLAELCHVVPVNAQCWQMAPYSSFVAELKNQSALVPQGQDGTVWATVGSNANPFDHSDGLVGSASATSMQIPYAKKMIMPWYKLVFHTMYTRNKTVGQFVAKSLIDTSAGVAQRKLASVVTSSAETMRVAVTSGTVEKSSTNADVTVSRAQALQDVDAMDSNQSPAEITPYLVKDVQAGIQLNAVLAGGIFDQMGLQNADVVQGCTSATLNNPFEGLAAMSDANASGSIKLCILRGNQKINRVVAFQ